MIMVNHFHEDVWSRRQDRRQRAKKCERRPLPADDAVDEQRHEHREHRIDERNADE
jgi:hypothetical protein